MLYFKSSRVIWSGVKWRLPQSMIKVHVINTDYLEAG